MQCLLARTVLASLCARIIGVLVQTLITLFKIEPDGATCRQESRFAWAHPKATLGPDAKHGGASVHRFSSAELFFIALFRLPHFLQAQT
jgi:hypothetical protein